MIGDAIKNETICCTQLCCLENGICGLDMQTQIVDTIATEGVCLILNGIEIDFFVQMYNRIIRLNINWFVELVTYIQSSLPRYRIIVADAQESIIIII